MKNLKLLIAVLGPMVVLALIAAVPGPPSTEFTRGFMVTTNQATAQAYLGVSGGGSSTNPTTVIYVTNVFATNITAITLNVTTNNTTVLNSSTINYHVAKGGQLILTNDLLFAWNELTMSGSNVSTINLTNGLMHKLLLTNDAFIGIPINFPGTNFGRTFQIHVAQDGTGGRSLMLTNASWVLNGSGVSTNAIPAVSTNANAISVLTFSTSPFTQSKLYGVLATTP